jgi:hypothetical protein
VDHGSPVTPATATTGIVLHFGLHQVTKKPRTFQGGASGSDDAIVTYARTPPEALEGLPAFAVRLVLVVMARAYAGDFGRRQRVLRGKIGINEVESDVVVTR